VEKARCGVSVVVCCHTDERWGDICNALASVRSQVGAADEIIVVVDHAPALLERIRGEFDDLAVVENTSVRGLAGARNRGVAVARAEIVAFIDDDAIAADDWLDRLCEPYADPAVVAVGGRVEPRWDGSRPVWFPPEFDWVVGCTSAGHPGEGPIRTVLGANMSFRRAIFTDLGGFDGRVGHGGAVPAGCEETELCTRIREQRPDAVVWYAPRAVVHHRVRRERATFAAFRARCRAEGGSRARVARLVVLRATLRDLRLAFGRQWRGASARVLARVAGVVLAALGFAAARHRGLRRRQAKAVATAPFRPAFVGPLDITAPVAVPGGRSIDGTPYERAVLLVRYDGRPCGTVEIELPPDGLSAPAVELRLREAIVHGDLVVAPSDDSPVAISIPWTATKTPRVTVVVATRDRPAALRRCVDSILACEYPDFDVLIVDNAPTWHATPPDVIEAYGPSRRVEWAREQTPGLASAHNNALDEVRSPIVAFTDDDVVVDKHWLTNVVAAFLEAPDIGCVTGMTFPLELETAAQERIARSISFDKGFTPRMFRADGRDDPLFPYAAGRFGSGANMAFRTDALLAIGGFDAALGAGTRTRGGDDLAAFFDIISSGYALVYEPAAIVFHAHCRDEAAMAQRAFADGAGLTAYLTKTVADRPTRLFELACRVPAGLRHCRRRDDYSRALVRRERVGLLAGPALYVASRIATRRVRRVPAGAPRAHDGDVSAVGN
jgi:GT2 family glycosyltransferase